MFVSPFVDPLVSPFVEPFVVISEQTVQQEQVSNPTPPEIGLPRYVNYLADYSGCGHWRILWPEQVINAEGYGCSQSLTAMIFDPRWYQDVRAVKVQRQASSAQKQFIQFLKEIQKESRFKLIYEVDDVVFKEEIPNYNKFKFAFDNDEIRTNCVDIINMCDEVVVTCDYMRKLYQEKTGKKEITVIPNFISYSWMGHFYNKDKIRANYEKNKKRPRVLYTGSGAHYDVDFKNNGVDDFSHVLQTVVKTIKKYQWVFVGSYPPQLHRFVVSGDIEFYPWQTLAKYPEFISNLNVQVTIAPLQDNNFNRSKSDIKYIESCVLGLPCIVQDLVTYENALDYLKFKTGEELEDRIEQILKNRVKYCNNVPVYREIGAQRFLERPENIGCHLELLNTPYNSPDRKYLKKYN